MVEFIEKVKFFLVEFKRVLFVIKKLGMKEFKFVVKIIGIGMIFIGIIGMIIRIIGYFVMGF